MTTTNKDFKVKHGLAVTAGATFGQAIEIGTPTADNHAATKGYVDQSISGAVMDPVIVATTGNINIATDTIVGDVIDGITLQDNTRILIKNQTDPTQNGIYNTNTSGPATRSLDFSSSDVFYTGSRVHVVFGTINGETSWVVSSYDNDIGVDPITFKFLGPLSVGEGLSVVNNQIELDDEFVAKVFVDGGGATNLSSDITKSSLTTVGSLDSLTVVNSSTLNGATLSGNLEVDGTAEFSGTVTVPEPTSSAHAASKNYVDSLVGQGSVEITTIDDLSNYFNGYNSRFFPTYKGLPVTLQNPFNLLLTIDGIIQSVGSPDYVWQSVMPRVGFRIDNDGYIAFPEAIPVGSSFDARVLVGSATTTQTKVYPFKAMDIVLGGY